MGDIQSRDWLTSVYFLGLSFHLIRKYVMYGELLLAPMVAVKMTADFKELSHMLKVHPKSLHIYKWRIKGG